MTAATMTPFDIAVAWIMSPDVEGFLSDDPSDNGGRTKYGISQANHPDVRVDELTPEDAVGLYRDEYWTPYHLDQLPSPLAMAVFDGIVQHGPKPAIRMLQHCVKTEMDGVLGPITAAKCRGPNVPYLLRLYLAHRAVYYSHLSDFDHFGCGWFDRLLSLHSLCLQGGGNVS